MTLLRPALAASLLLGVAASSFADQPHTATNASTFVGIFYPSMESVSVDPVRCPDASHPVLIRFTGTAYTTLGSATIAQSHCVGPAQSSFRHGQQEMTFASGWKIFGTYTGQTIATPTTAVDGVMIADGRYRNTGGTGPFKNAHGTGISAGTIDARTGAVVVTVSGTL